MEVRCCKAKSVMLGGLGCVRKIEMAKTAKQIPKNGKMKMVKTEKRIS